MIAMDRKDTNQIREMIAAHDRRSIRALASNVEHMKNALIGVAKLADANVNALDNRIKRLENAVIFLGVVVGVLGTGLIVLLIDVLH